MAQYKNLVKDLVSNDLQWLSAFVLQNCKIAGVDGVTVADIGAEIYRIGSTQAEFQDVMATLENYGVVEVGADFCVITSEGETLLDELIEQDEDAKNQLWVEAVKNNEREAMGHPA